MKRATYMFKTNQPTSSPKPSPPKPVEENKRTGAL